VAVLLPEKFIFLAHPHTGSSAMVLALQDVFPEALDLRPHHMSLDDVKGKPGAVRMEQISRRRERVWTPRKQVGDYDPDVVRKFVKGTEHVFSVVRNPYDFLASCYVRRGRGQSFSAFVKSYRQDPYIRDGKIYYHLADSQNVLRYENLQEELNQMMAHLGLPGVPLQRHNVTADKKPWESYYDPTSYAIVNERFGAEFSRFYDPRTA
jgi:hypothetical protein